jgi:prephenate dehydrogenase
LHGILRELDANVMALDFDTHDRLVAMASHVPHLVAGALMNEAASMAESDGALLQLAAGGFRDMTRVSAGDPGIWPDVLLQNAPEVVASLRGLRGRLADLETSITGGDREGLMTDLVRASRARRALPGRGVHSEDLAHLRVPVPDRPGVLAQVTTTASDLNVNIYDIEIAHSVEGQPGVIMLAVVRDQADRLVAALAGHGYRVAREEPT